MREEISKQSCLTFAHRWFCRVADNNFN